MSPRPSSRQAPEPVVAPAGPVSPQDEQLARILRSETFQQADRLKCFLTFVVTEAIEGRQAALKEYVIGVQVFRKEESYDPRTDPIVRVQARRLRAKLVRYYREEGRADSLIIELPKGGYVPVFRSRETTVLVGLSGGNALSSRNVVVVEAFADRGPARDLGPYCEAVRDEVIHQLTRVRGLSVMAPRPSTDREIDEPTRGKVVIVGGSIRQARNRLRIGVHLLDATTRCYLWSEVVEADTQDSFSAQDRVARALVDRLEAEWRAGGGFLNAPQPAVNLAAQNLYVQGRYHMNQRTEEGLRRAVDFFERALAEGQEFAPAHSGLADAYALLSHYGVLGPAEVWTKAASRAASAVKFDDQCAEAHTSLAHVKAAQDFDWAGAEKGFQRAISLNPSYATAHHWYAMSCLVPTGRLDDALDEILLAQSLDPVSSIVARDLAMVHFYRRNFDLALEQCDHAIELNPHFGPAYWMLGVVQEQRRDLDESLAALQRAVHLSPNAPRMYGALGRTLALSGRKKLARDLLRKLAEFAEHRYVSPVDFAWIHLGLGEVDQGFTWLAKAGADRSFELITIKVDPRFDPYRSDPRYTALLTQLGFE